MQDTLEYRRNSQIVKQAKYLDRQRRNRQLLWYLIDSLHKRTAFNQKMKNKKKIKMLHPINEEEIEANSEDFKKKY